MSKCYKATTYSARALENAWMNSIFNNHDLFCICDNPLDHLKELIKRDQCRHSTDAATTTETGGDTKTDEIGLDEGDLDTLFAISDDAEG